MGPAQLSGHKLCLPEGQLAFPGSYSKGVYGYNSCIALRTPATWRRLTSMD